MWAQDAAAMYGYAANSAAASQVTPFTAAPQTTNPAGSAVQSAAVTQAAGTAAGTAAGNVQASLSQISTMLQSLATPAASSTTSGSGLSTFLSGLLGDLGLTGTSSAASPLRLDRVEFAQRIAISPRIFRRVCGSRRALAHYG